MKRLIVLILICIPLFTSAQKLSFESLVQTYSQKDGYTTIELSPMMLKSMGVSNGVEAVQAISVEQESLIEEFIQSVESAISGLERFMSINSDGKRVSIYGRSDDAMKGMVELVILTVDNKEGVAVRVTGCNIEISDIDSFINGL